MADLKNGLFTCDLCGDEMAESYRCELYAEYRTRDVKDVCGKCRDEIHAAWRKAKRVTDGLLNGITRRWIRRARRVKIAARGKQIAAKQGDKSV